MSYDEEVEELCEIFRESPFTTIDLLMFVADELHKGDRDKAIFACGFFLSVLKRFVKKIHNLDHDVDSEWSELAQADLYASAFSLTNSWIKEQNPEEIHRLVEEYFEEGKA